MHLYLGAGPLQRLRLAHALRVFAYQYEWVALLSVDASLESMDQEHDSLVAVLEDHCFSLIWLGIVLLHCFDWSHLAAGLLHGFHDAGLDAVDSHFEVVSLLVDVPRSDTVRTQILTTRSRIQFVEDVVFAKLTLYLLYLLHEGTSFRGFTEQILLSTAVDFLGSFRASPTERTLTVDGSRAILVLLAALQFHDGWPISRKVHLLIGGTETSRVQSARGLWH